MRLRVSSAKAYSRRDRYVARPTYHRAALLRNGLERAKRTRPRLLPPLTPSLRRAAVHFALCHRGQLFVGRFFLLEILLKQSRDLVPPEFLCPSDQGPVARDVVVLDRLRRRNQGGIQNRFVFHF